MSSIAGLVAVSTVAGTVLGAGMLPVVGAQLRATQLNITTRAVTPILTGIMVGALAVVLGARFDLLLYGVFAVFSVALATIDILERRLPAQLMLTATVLVLGLLTISAILTGGGSALLRAALAAAALAGSYLVLALATHGGLGAGDVKLAVMIGATTGWISWSTVLTATALAWTAAAVGWTARAIARSTRTGALPMGPFLLAGAFAAILMARV